MIMFKNLSLISTTLLSIIIFSFSTFANSDEIDLEIKEINETIYTDLVDMKDYYIAAVKVDEICGPYYKKENIFTGVMGQSYQNYLNITKRQHYNALLLAHWYVKQKYSNLAYESFERSIEKSIRESKYTSFYFDKHREIMEAEKELEKDEMQSYIGACNAFKNNFLTLWHLTHDNETKFTDLLNEMKQKINIPNEFGKDYLFKHVQLYNDLWRQY